MIFRKFIRFGRGMLPLVSQKEKTIFAGVHRGGAVAATLSHSGKGKVKKCHVHVIKCDSDIQVIGSSKNLFGFKDQGSDGK